MYGKRRPMIVPNEMRGKRGKRVGAVIGRPNGKAYEEKGG